MVVRDLIPEDEDEDDRLILTAAHLILGVPDGTRILASPRGPEPQSVDGHFCGTVRRRVPLTNLPTIGVDAAVIKPAAGFDCCNDLEGGSIRGVRDLWVVDDDADTVSVLKHGAQTGLTTGELYPIAADHLMHDVRARYNCGWWAYGSDGTAFATTGDSGSIALDRDRRAVGMVVAVDRRGEGAAAFVHGIKQVLMALQIALP